MIYRIQHQTRYTSVERVSVGHNEAWLTPRNTRVQNCLSHRIQIVPEPSVVVDRVDYFHNVVTQFAFNQGYDVLDVTAHSEVEVFDPVRPTAGGPPWEEVVAAVRSHRLEADLEAFEFTFPSPRCRYAPEFATYGLPSFFPGRPVLDAVGDLMGRFHSDVEYDPTATTVSTPVEQVFRHKRGVCQDFAHLLISVCISLGVPARYVSGYLRTLPPSGKPRLVGADASHAWVSVYCGPLGWIDIDPTNNQFPGSDYVTIAWGRDYTDGAPLKGVYIGGSSLQMQVSVDVA
ncbi:MAG: transglutaminase family protein [Planctomycetia bacterium]|nr:transglutaminase family protein [Planctomycetia bacterium]